MKDQAGKTAEETEIVEKLYDAFANWYHDDGDYDTFLRSEALKTFKEYADQFRASKQVEEATETGYLKNLVEKYEEIIGGDIKEIESLRNALEKIRKECPEGSWFEKTITKALKT